MTDPSDANHPGLGQATDISATDLGAADLDAGSDAATPATNDPAEFDDAGLGVGDGPDLGGLGGTDEQPGGAG